MSWGEGADVFMVSEWDREIGVKSSHSLGEKAVEQSDSELWYSGTFYLMAGAGRGCGRDGWGPSRCWRPCWSIAQGKCPGWRGEGHRWSLRQCSLFVVGSCGQQHCSSHTRQWCSWSAHSQWCQCRKWWGWVEGDLPFSAGGESGGTVVPSCWVTWRWWSRSDPL